MKNTLAHIDHSVWELGKLVAKNPERFTLRSDFLKFFHESRLFIERKRSIPEEDRSFLLLQDHDSPCCLLLHGAGGSPAEMRTLGEHLFKLGYTVYGTRLSLGGEDGNSNRSASKGGTFKWARFGKKRKASVRTGYNWERCLADAEVVLGAMLTFARNTYIVGFSFGGTVALDLMRRFPVKGAVLIAPALFPVKDGRYIAFKLVRSVAPFAAKGIVPREYTLLEFVERTRTRLQKIPQPIMVIHAAHEKIVSSRSLRFLQGISANPKSRFELLDSNRHVLIRGDDSQKVFKLCADFLREV